MAWVKDQQWLFAGTAGGLIGWHLPIKVLTGSVPAKPSMIDFELVPDSETREYGQVVDSVCTVQSWSRSGGSKVRQLWQDSRLQG